MGEGRRQASSGGPTWAPFLATDLTELMAPSWDQKELLWAWQGWWDAVGPQLQITFECYMQLSNKAAKLSGEAPDPMHESSLTRTLLGLRARPGRGTEQCPW